MINKLFWIGILCTAALLFVACSGQRINQDQEKLEINQLVDQWHHAAGIAEFEAYFSCFADEAVFIGTDATENWDVESFRVWAKPYFDKGKAWDFKALQRNIYFGESSQIAWFDELLDTQMKICRGSGVLVKNEGSWKIKHYVLSMTIPNENTSEVVKIKATIEDELFKQLLGE